MSNVRTLGTWLRRFLSEYIVTERNLSINTQKSYRDTFRLLLPFLSASVGKAIDRLAIGDLTSHRVRRFLMHLENDRGCSVQTRNQRLAAIRALARFVASRDPARVDWYGHIRAIPTKKAMPRPIAWLSRAEIDAMLAVPDRMTLRGRIEHALLLFLYNTGARVSEATQLRIRDLQIGHSDDGHALVTLYGKGRKSRQCPLWPDTKRVLATLVKGRATDEAVFLSRHGKAFTRFGVYRLVARCADRVPALADRKITPHVLRHTTACHLVQAGVDINTIRAWLGHVSLDTTNIYAEIDLDAKAEAIALCETEEAGPHRPWKENPGLMAFLKSL